MNKYLALLVVGLLLVTGCRSDPDPISVIEQAGRNEAAHDVEATMDLLAEDVIFEVFGTQYNEKAEIEIIIQGGHIPPRKMEFIDIEAEGNQVTWIVRVGEGQFAREYLNDALVEGGKIVHWRILEQITP
jgi:hypothetical protein